jgi:hypothetical protein
MAGEKVLRNDISVALIESDPKVKSFSVNVVKKELRYGFAKGLPYYLTKMVAAIEVFDTKDLKDYAVVQYNRGCLFNSKKTKNGTIIYSNGPTRQFFDDTEFPHSHKDWVIDSIDKDPAYWSAPQEYGRLSKYRLNDPMIPQTEVRPVYMKSSLTDQTISYVRDMPTGASYYAGAGHLNASIDFRTCLYKLSDLPLETSPDGASIAGKELKCFDWGHHYIFNYAKSKYEITKKIHPYCLK